LRRKAFSPPLVPAKR